MPLLRAWLIAFAITVTSELAIAVPLLGAGNTRARRVAVVCLAQLATHPSVWFIWPLLDLSRVSFLLLAESFAFVAEALIYRLCFEQVGWSRCFAASALANATSMLIGLW